MNKLIFQTPEQNIRIKTNEFKGIIPNKNDIIILYGIKYVVRERIFSPLNSELQFVLESIS